MPTIAVDAMGGDFGADPVVQGVARVSIESDIQSVLVGDARVVQRLLDSLPYRPEKITIVHAASHVRMDEDPREAIRRRDTSLWIAAEIVASGRADALVSAGNTGAAVLACAKTFRTIKGIRKTALASVIPRKTEHPGQDPLALLLDVGATIRCDAVDLVHFAIMGSAYAKRISKVDRPRVGLLNMGSEPIKGGEVLVAAYERLARTEGIHFVGNLEGNDVAKGKADVIVCEGFVGNVVLKLLEGVSEIILDLASYASRERLRWRLGLAMLSTGVRQVRVLTDYASYGGAPILGFENLFIKAHGRSNAKAIANAVKVAAKAVRDGVPREIAERVTATR